MEPRSPYEKRNREILDRFLNGESKSDIANSVGLSRERIGQIIENLSGERSPLNESPINVPFRAINDLRKTLGISQAQIAVEAGVNKYSTIHILNGDPRNIKNATRNPNSAAAKVIQTTLKMCREKLIEAELLVREISDAV